MKSVKCLAYCRNEDPGFQRVTGVFHNVFHTDSALSRPVVNLDKSGRKEVVVMASLLIPGRCLQ